MHRAVNKGPKNGAKDGKQGQKSRPKSPFPDFSVEVYSTYVRLSVSIFCKYLALADIESGNVIGVVWDRNGGEGPEKKGYILRSRQSIDRIRTARAEPSNQIVQLSSSSATLQHQH